MTHSEAEKKKEFYISVEMDEDFCRRLAPSPRILIWMVTPAELIADMLDFTVDGAFSNKVGENCKILSIVKYCVQNRKKIHNNIR